MTRSDDRLTAPYRAVRPITAPGDGPWPGMLTSLPSGARGVLVDADVLGPGWKGWDAAPDGHVLGPLDVVRTPGGHEVILPVCPESVDAFVARRQASAHPLEAGEAVTIGVSLLRGCADVLGGRPVAGEWWLTDAGRPVFATDAAPRPALEATIELLAMLSRAAPHPTAWAESVTAVSATRMSAAELDRAETGLFAVADAMALDLAPTGARAPVGFPASLEGPGDVQREPRRGLWEHLARHVDADLADLVSRATTGIWRRARAPRKERRRAPLVVGAGVAVAVVAVGLMWPQGGATVTPAGAGGASVTAAPDPATTGATPSPAGDAAGETSHSEAGAPTDAGVASEARTGASAAEDAGGAEDLEATATVLLERLDACGDDHSCISEITVDATAAGVASPPIPPARRIVVLLDDFGGIAVLRVDDADGDVGSQLVVIARRDGEWLLRDVQDAAQQP